MKLLLFRFRRHRSKIVKLYEVFHDHSERMMHPMELSRASGMHMLDVMRVMDGVPEIFFKVPTKQAGGTKYALRLSVASMPVHEVLNFIRRRARYEQSLYIGCVVIVVVGLLVMCVISIPHIATLFQ